MIKSVITAAGKGTRLLPITKELPKEMMPIFSKIYNNNLIVIPLLQFIFEQLYGIGIRDYCFVVVEKKDQLKIILHQMKLILTNYLKRTIF